MEELKKNRWTFSEKYTCKKQFECLRRKKLHLHVYNTLCIMVAVIKSGGLKNKWLIKAFTVVLSVLIILSTLFLKQHSFIDLLAALALYAVLYVITYFIMKKLDIRPLVLYNFFRR